MFEGLMLSNSFPPPCLKRHLWKLAQKTNWDKQPTIPPFPTIPSHHFHFPPSTIPSHHFRPPKVLVVMPCHYCRRPKSQRFEVLWVFRTLVLTGEISQRHPSLPPWENPKRKPGHKMCENYVQLPNIFGLVWKPVRFFVLEMKVCFSYRSCNLLGGHHSLSTTYYIKIRW